MQRWANDPKTFEMTFNWSSHSDFTFTHNEAHDCWTLKHCFVCRHSFTIELKDLFCRCCLWEPHSPSSAARQPFLFTNVQSVLWLCTLAGNLATGWLCSVDCQWVGGVGQWADELSSALRPTHTHPLAGVRPGGVSGRLSSGRSAQPISVGLRAACSTADVWQQVF